MAETQYKICPQCRTHAELSAPVCAKCGRIYKTQFAQPDQMTQVFSPPQPVQASPHYPQSPLVAGGSNSYLLDECARQYRQMNLWIILSIVGFFTGLFAIVAFGYSHFIGKPAIRRRVAEMGVNPVAWAAPMDAIFWKATKAALIVVAALIGTLITVLVIGNIGYKLTKPSTPSAGSDDGFGSEQHYYGSDGKVIPKSQEPVGTAFPDIPSR